MALIRSAATRASRGSLALLLLLPLASVAAPAAGPPAPTGEEGAAAESSSAQEVGEALVPPVPLAPVAIPWPEEPPALEAPVEVEVLLHVDETGAVVDVRLERSAGTPWDEAVLEACRLFRFSPARLDGTPIAVEIPFVQRFEPRPVEAAAEETPLDAALRGQVLEMGTRRVLPAAEVVALAGGRTWRGLADDEGRFELPLPAGAAEVEVVLPGYRRFVVRERIGSGQSLQVRYLVQRESYHPFERVVIGEAVRQEESRTTLRERELRRVPGTFGDPLRVVSTLPGVGQVLSLVDYPVVRGASPGSSGVLLDGDRIPQLFHFLAGPAVIHPEFLDRVDFYPGNFPVEYGGYTGGIVDAATRSARLDERRIEIGADLLNSSAFVRQPVLGATGTVAARYGYPGMLLRAFSEDTYASYWDYQARLDGGSGAERWTLFAYGSFDELGEVRDGREQTSLQSLFHRLKLRWTETEGRSVDRYELAVGLDQLMPGSGRGEEDEFGEIGRARGPERLQSWVIHPRASWRRPLASSLDLQAGLELQWRTTSSSLSLDEEDRAYHPSDWMTQLGGFAATPWWITDDFLLTPGLRLDVWESNDTRQASIDPRLNWRWRVDRDEAKQVWLKGGVGLFHQPPRPPIPIPGTSELLLEQQLPAALHTSVGSELDLASGWFFDVQTYFNYMDPIVFDLALNRRDDATEEDVIDLTRPRVGRAYGLEVLLRRKDHGDLFGWVSYTLSRSERRTETGWTPFDFDRTHMLQVVAGLRLPRDWELGGRFQLVSGRPLTAPGEPLHRAAPFTRFDLRIDKRAVYRSWMLDFYVELVNAMITTEQVAEGSNDGLRYIFPTVGFRAVL